MLWSRYNHLFRSQRNGGIAYNALANSLFELDDAHYRVVDGLRAHGIADPGDAALGADPAFLAALREHGILVEEGEEDRLLLARHYARHALCFDGSFLGLTICPTLACNFRCAYCYEDSQRDGATMTTETVDRLITFIRGHEGARRLSVTWYGGEPTLAWDVIEEATERMLALDIAYQGAGLVTNGFLLSGAKAARLNRLHITNIQTTLDGPPEVHDRRRVLAGGGPTYARILENVAVLMDSDYEGTCVIRVNVDRRNLESFLALRGELLERFKGTKLEVYAGHVNTRLGHGYDHECSIDAAGWADFAADVHQRGGGLPHGGFFPPDAVQGVCVATTHTGYVVGPRGELYKCWEDVGKPQLVIGDLHADDPITDPGLRALYSLGTDAFADPDCTACAVLPICGGGCPNKRLRALHFHEEGLVFCSPYKDRLATYLEEYLESLRTREVLAQLLDPEVRPASDRGYRAVHPKALEAPQRATARRM
jgi:uncharacterized protein